MKNTLKKRTFISAIAMLVVSAIVLTSSTFAWFSMAKRVEVETMQLNITSPDGVQLSGNANAFTTMLTLADLKGETTARWAAYEGNQNNFPELLKPVSSCMNFVSSLPRFFEGSINDAKKISASLVKNEKGSGFVAFDIFVQVGQDQQVYWNETSITCKDNPDVVSAMRVALINCGTVAAKADAATILSRLPVNHENHRAVMYEPNANIHTEASGYTKGETVPEKYVAIDVNDRDPGGRAGNIIVDEYYLSPTTATVARDDNKATTAFFDAKEGINRIRVYLWMEGNDVDCANDVAGATIDFNLVLTIK